MRIVFRLTINNELIDADTDSVVFRDDPETPTYGIKRQDTQEILVSHGTPLIRESLGTYTFNLIEPYPNLIYEYNIEYSIGGIPETVPRTQSAFLSNQAYSSVDAADDFFSNIIHAEDWFAQSDTDKAKLLFETTQLIDRYDFKYNKTNSEQLLEFPRNGAIEIPDDILKAQYYGALELAKGFDLEREVAGMRVTSRGYSAVRTTYDPSNMPEHLLAGFPSAKGWAYLLPYLRNTGTIKLHRVS